MRRYSIFSHKSRNKWLKSSLYPCHGMLTNIGMSIHAYGGYTHGLGGVWAHEHMELDWLGYYFKCMGAMGWDGQKVAWISSHMHTCNRLWRHGSKLEQSKVYNGRCDNGGGDRQLAVPYHSCLKGPHAKSSITWCHIVSMLQVWFHLISMVSKFEQVIHCPKNLNDSYGR